MDNLTNISTIKELLSKNGFTFSKSLGQNFIVNSSICPKMAEFAIVDDNTGVIEIGPGIGVLTNELCKKAKKVVAIELDKRLLPILSETLSEYDNLKIINADALKIDLNKIICDEFSGMNVVICANLPYYITSPIIMKILEEKVKVSSMVVMVQKEAANRICADVGSRECGAVTVAVHYYSKPEVLFRVSSGSFIPVPKVDSSVIQLNVFSKPRVDVKDEKTFFRVVKASFAQRRKTLSNSLSSGLSIDKNMINDILKTQGIEPQLRAERLSLEDFKNISDEVFERGL